MILFGLRVCVVSGCFVAMLPDVLSCVYGNTCLYIYCFSRWHVQNTHTHTHIQMAVETLVSTVSYQSVSGRLQAI